MKVSQEIMVIFREETGKIEAVAEQSCDGLKLFHTRKMNKDDIAHLLMENNPEEKHAN